MRYITVTEGSEYLVIDTHDGGYSNPPHVLARCERSTEATKIVNALNPPAPEE